MQAPHGRLVERRKSLNEPILKTTIACHSLRRDFDAPPRHHTMLGFRRHFGRFASIWACAENKSLVSLVFVNIKNDERERTRAHIESTSGRKRFTVEARRRTRPRKELRERRLYRAPFWLTQLYTVGRSGLDATMLEQERALLRASRARVVSLHAPTVAVAAADTAESRTPASSKNINATNATEAAR